MIKNLKKNVSIKLLELTDIPNIVEAFKQIGWNKPSCLFEGYYEEQHKKDRIILLAYMDKQFTGYITLKWLSRYASFAKQNIPEIMDLNVLPSYRREGIGKTLLRLAEKEARSQSEIVGIGVGLYGGPDGGYGPAQRLYISTGYLPDGLGVTYNYQATEWGKPYSIDDELVLWLTKKLN